MRPGRRAACCRPGRRRGRSCPCPANLTLPASLLPCAGPHAYPARWVTGAAREPGSSGRVLISYADWCVTGPDAFTLESFGLVELRSGGQRARRRRPRCSPCRPAGSRCTAVPGPRLAGLPRRLPVPVRLVRAELPRARRGLPGPDAATAAWWDNGFTYRYWTGRGWSADPAGAATLTGRGPRGCLGRRLRGRRAGTGHDRADQRGGRLQPVAGGGARRALAQDRNRPGPVHRGEAGRRPVPRADRPSGAERPGATCSSRSSTPERTTSRLGLPVVTCTLDGDRVRGRNVAWTADPACCLMLTGTTWPGRRRAAAG